MTKRTGPIFVVFGATIGLLANSLPSIIQYDAVEMISLGFSFLAGILMLGGVFLTLRNIKI